MIFMCRSLCTNKTGHRRKRCVVPHSTKLFVGLRLAALSLHLPAWVATHVSGPFEVGRRATCLCVALHGMASCLQHIKECSLTIVGVHRSPLVSH